MAVPLPGGNLQGVKKGESEDDDISHSNYTDMDGLSIATPHSAGFDLNRFSTKDSNKEGTKGEDGEDTDETNYA